MSVTLREMQERGQVFLEIIFALGKSHGDPSIQPTRSVKGFRQRHKDLVVKFGEFDVLLRREHGVEREIPMEAMGFQGPVQPTKIICVGPRLAGRVTNDAVSILKHYEARVDVVPQFGRQLAGVLLPPNVCPPLAVVQVREQAIPLHSPQQLNNNRAVTVILCHGCQLEDIRRNRVAVEHYRAVYFPNRSRNPSSKNPSGQGSKSWPSSSSSNSRTTVAES